MMVNARKRVEALLRLRRRARGMAWTFWIRAWGGTVGRRLEVDRGAVLRHPPGRGMRIGDDVYVGVGTVLDVHPGAELHIGSRTKIMQYVVIASSLSVKIGDKTQIAEFTSVRDADHGISLEAPMQDQIVSSPVVIGSDVWLARSVAILRGVVIEDGVVVGANAVVRDRVAAHSIAVGVPARVIRVRT